MSYKNRAESLPRIVDTINKIANGRPNVKGVIHCTYGTSFNLKKVLKNERFMFHVQSNKAQIYEQFLESKKPHILVACGMSEGIDLKYDLARFQIILEVMFPSLTDNVNFWRMHHKPQHFKMDAFDTLVQQYGRGCRAPDDTCETFVLDAQSERLIQQVRIPKWLLPAIQKLAVSR
jgi:Rad3-related DNA helicase